MRRGVALATGDVIGFVDADYKTPIEEVTKLLPWIADGFDLAIGSRYKTGVNVVNWPIGRVIMSYYASTYVRIITGMPIHGILHP